MKTKDELIQVVRAALNKFGGDKLRARDYLLAQAEIDDDLMLGFALHGKVITEVMNESIGSIKH
jgi:hypothetical protein